MTDLDWNVLDRYASGDATADEVAALEHWAAGDATRRALLDAMRRPAAASATWNTDAAWNAVRRRAFEIEAPDLGARAVSPTERAARQWGVVPSLLRAAAVIAVISGAVLLARTLQRSSPASDTDVLAAMTLRSESDTVRLADGTVVILAAASRLDHPRTFGATSREVQLIGTAWFDVATDSARPFTIAAGHAVVRVVGTQFVARTPLADEQGDVTVAVLEGAVSVRAARAAHDSGVVIRRGQVARVAVSGETSAAATDLEPYVGWIEGRLVFDDASLADVLAELSHWYDVEFRADAALTSRRVTARLRTGSLDQSVEALSLAIGAAHRRSNDTITFMISPR